MARKHTIGEIIGRCVIGGILGLIGAGSIGHGTIGLVSGAAVMMVYAIMTTTKSEKKQRQRNSAEIVGVTVIGGFVGFLAGAAMGNGTIGCITGASVLFLLGGIMGMTDSDE